MAGRKKVVVSRDCSGVLAIAASHLGSTAYGYYIIGVAAVSDRNTEYMLISGIGIVHIS